MRIAKPKERERKRKKKKKKRQSKLKQCKVLDRKDTHKKKRRVFGLSNLVEGLFFLAIIITRIKSDSSVIAISFG